MDAAGTAQLTGAVLPNPGSDWHTIGSDDLNFISATSTTGTLAATSQADEFVLTSHVFGLETISGFDPRQDILELRSEFWRPCRGAGKHCCFGGWRSAYPGWF
jgi:hypothetical protein